MRELTLDELDEVSGGRGLFGGWVAGKLMDAAWDAVQGYKNSGAAADFAMGAGSGAGTFG